MNRSTAPNRRERFPREALRRLTLGVVACALLGASDDATTRDAMRRLLGGLEQLLPLSLDESAFGDPARAASIRSQLDVLAASASAVSAHAARRDRGIRYLGRGLEMEARQARELFDLGALTASRYSLLQITEYCVACHSRLPDAEDPTLARRLTDRARGEIDAAQRAHLEIATRQFDRALETLEASLAEPGLGGLDLLGQVTSYLVVAIQVKQDFERPVPTLRRIAEKPDVWTHLRRDVRSWIDALDALAKRAATSDRLEDAVAVIDAGRSTIGFPSDRRALVHYVAASGVLQRFLEREGPSPQDRARAYYLLGVVESRIGSTYALSLPSFYLETAIREDPGGRVAEPSYAMLEELTLCEFSLDCAASPGELPPDVEVYLEDLRALAAGERTARDVPDPLNPTDR